MGFRDEKKSLIIYVRSKYSILRVLILNFITAEYITKVLIILGLSAILMLIYDSLPILKKDYHIQCKKMYMMYEFAFSSRAVNFN